MIEQAGVIEIERAADEVFAFAADLSNFPRWQPADQVEKLGHGPLRGGVKFRQRLRLPGQTVPLECEIIEFSHNRQIRFRFSGPGASGEAGYTFEPILFATRVTARGRLEAGGWLAGLLAGRLRGQLQANLAALKRAVEAPAASKNAERPRPAGRRK
jgi:hypothetical protein